MRLSAEKSHQRREELIHTGIAVFRRFGYNGVGIQELADAAGMPKGSFYNYFATKEEFAREAMLRYQAAAFEHADHYLDDASVSPPAAIIAMYRARVRAERRLLRAGTACLGNMFAQELGDQLPDVQKEVRRLFTEMKARLARVIQRGQARGEIRKDRSARDLAEFLENAWRGTMLAARGESSHRALSSFVDTVEILLQPAGRKTKIRSK